MYNYKIILVIALYLTTATAQWMCLSDADCSDLERSLCLDGTCKCPLGTQMALGGSKCADLAPYHTSTCFEDSQCTRLFIGFECRRENITEPGTCRCQTGHHFFHGRCWRSVLYGEPCTRNEECHSLTVDPYSLSCNGVCGCSEGYYSRQRGECRRIASAVDDACIIDEDCQFENGVCDLFDLKCRDSSQVPEVDTLTRMKTVDSEVVSHSAKLLTEASGENGTESSEVVACGTGCASPFVCFQGVCVCPIGYYGVGNECFAELGSASTEEQCIGFSAVVENGECKCPPHFFYAANMRDCVRPTRRIQDSCTSDDNCHTFGAAASCGEPQEDNWGVRSCQCDLNVTVWDSTLSMCRLFVGVGEMCELDEDCLAGEVEIQCVKDESGQGFCTCPEDLLEVDGLCLRTGLNLGDQCQATLECSETEHAICEAGVCTCGNGYQADGDICAPVIGGLCSQDSDCVIENTVCANNSNIFTCQCKESFVAYDEICWPVSPSFGSFCNVTAQCYNALGSDSACVDNICACSSAYHYRDDGCWPVTNLFEPCTRTSQCYLNDNMSDRVVCRNSICQCQFTYPYSESLHTCTSTDRSVSSASAKYLNYLIFLISTFCLLLR